MKIYHSLAFATALLAVGCANNEDVVTPDPVIPDSQKEMISFSLSDNSAAQTRAGFLEGDTRILARFQSDNKETSPTEVRYTKAVLKATKNATNTAEAYSSVAYMTIGETRYWDDAFGRSANISVYAVAIPNSTDDAKLTEGKLAGGSTWNTTDTSNNIDWSVTAAQTNDIIAAEDLTYSNNIQATGTDGRYVWDYTEGKYLPEETGLTTHKAGRLKFTQAAGAQTSDPGHFDKGHMVFNHNLSRITVTLKKGDGFASTDPFKFTSGQIQLNNMYTSGTFDIKAGSWTSKNQSNITSLAPQATYTTAAGTFMAQMLPGFKFTDENTTAAMQFEIDNCIYYVTQDMLFDALKAGDLASATSPITMEMGKNYNFTITVKKTKIDNVTATLAAWSDVTAENKDLFNSYINLSLNSADGGACNSFDLYRLPVQASGPLTDKTDPTADEFENKAWAGNYTDKATLTDNGDGTWKTNWYFESNKEYYHFRSVNKSTTINTTPAKDNFAITSGAIATTDPHWGAPMVSGATLKYDATEANDANGVTKEGFSSSLYKAIGSTDDQIKMTEIHMLSNIKVILKTKDDGGKVDLKNATVTITKFAKTGTVDMGTGFVRATLNTTDQNQVMTAPDFSSWTTSSIQTGAYSWAVVPQTLCRVANSTNENDYIGITITTADNNQYYIVKDLSAILPESIKKNDADYNDPNQALTDAIKFWYPGHTYTYTFTISKKGIEDVTCTLAAWVDVNAANKDLTLED